MKRASLLRHLRKHGCVFKRDGRAHSPWMNPRTGQTKAVPRHSARLRRAVKCPATFS